MSGDSNIIRYNYIYNNKSDGIILQGYIFGTIHLQYPENNQIYHNTIVGNGRSGLYIGASDISYPDAGAFVRNNIIENNLLWNNGGGNFPDDLPYDIVANFYSANNPWSPGFTDGNIFRYNNASNAHFLQCIVIRVQAEIMFMTRLHWLKRLIRLGQIIEETIRFLLILRLMIIRYCRVVR